MTQDSILRTLSENTHTLFTEDMVTEANKAFGTNIKATEYRANPSDPKGLVLDNGAESAMGISARDLATELCDRLKVDYPAKHGRGFQVHACIIALRQAGYGKDGINAESA